MILLISYDLKVPGRDYAKLYEVLKSADGWLHHLESTWIVHTSLGVNEWTKKIQTVIDANDRFIVVDITGSSRNGWLTQKAWDWITKHQKMT